MLQHLADLVEETSAGPAALALGHAGDLAEEATAASLLRAARKD